MITILLCFYFGVNGYLAGKECDWAKSNVEWWALFCFWMTFGLAYIVLEVVLEFGRYFWRKFADTNLGFWIDFNIIRSYDDLKAHQLENVKKILKKGVAKERTLKRAKMVLKRNNVEA